MPDARDPEKLLRDSADTLGHGRTLRELSDRLLEEIKELRRLESAARTMPIGSPEFEQISREITDRARGVFRLTAEQEALGVEARMTNAETRLEGRTIDDVPDQGD